MARSPIYSAYCIRTKFNAVDVYTFPMKVRDILTLKYVAARGVSDEEGAVQRVLNKRRIGNIRDFVLRGNSFFNTFILNWTFPEITPMIKIENGITKISFPIFEEAAQVIDGQHRLSGIEEAVKLDPNVAGQEVLVSLCIRLTTSEAANIFLNINSEQKPVPKSLIYDLFGEVWDAEHLPVNRATDIANALNESVESPYYQMVQFPGSARGAGFIPLSTVVTALKPHLGTGGLFSRVKLTTLDTQKAVILNYFNAIQSAYKKHGYWTNKTKNPFLKSAGFNGAIDFLFGGLLIKCAEKKSFTVQTFSSLMSLEENLIFDEDIKKLDGKSARKVIKEHLENLMLSELPSEDDYEI